MSWQYHAAPVALDGYMYNPDPNDKALGLDTTGVVLPTVDPQYPAEMGYQYQEYIPSQYPYRPPPIEAAPLLPIQPHLSSAPLPAPSPYTHQAPPVGPIHAPYRYPPLEQPVYPPPTVVYPLPYYSAAPPTRTPAPLSAPPTLASFPPVPVYVDPQTIPLSAPPSNHDSQPSSSDGTGTISPSAIGQWQTADIKPSRSFSDLVNSRMSVSSEGSEGGVEWTPDTQAGVFSDWTGNLQQALPEGQSATSDYIPLPPVASSPIPTAIVPAGDHVPLDTIQEALRNYMTTANRLDYGERKLIIMSPKVGQKSYGTEKRFLCPHPQVVAVGKSWWRNTNGRPPRFNISITGEAPIKDASVVWSKLDGTQVSDDEMVALSKSAKKADIPFHGIAAGRSLHISDSDGKRRDVKAVVTVRSPLSNTPFGAAGSGAGEQILGSFESKDIKVISKPSKKKCNAKSSELIVTHGSTIALFNRVKSQTTSTRYLSVDTDFTQFYGSDGHAASGTVRPALSSEAPQFPGLTVHASAWESFIIWLVDPMKAQNSGFTEPLHADWPAGPSNAIPMSGGNQPVRYNSTVILQSLQTGICSPILVIRRIDSEADVVGMDGTITDPWVAVPDGELPGDLVSQLQKVAFELYDLDSHAFDTRMPSTWLACDQDLLIPKLVSGDRRWARVPPRQINRPQSLPSTPNTRFGILPLIPHSAMINLPPTPPSPAQVAPVDYFTMQSRNSSASPMLTPTGSEIYLPYTNDGGAVRRHRTSSNTNSPYARPVRMTPSGGRYSSHNSPASSYGDLPSTNPTDLRMFWTMDIGDLCVWSIVSTEQVSYSFFVPPYVDDAGHSPAPSPLVNRVIAPGNLSGASASSNNSRLRHQWINSSAGLVSIHGKNFGKRADGQSLHDVFYGDKPAQYAEVKSSEVLAVSEPLPEPGVANHEIFLVSEDGRCLYPSGFIYPATQVPEAQQSTA